MADQQPESSCSQVSEYDSETDQPQEKPLKKSLNPPESQIKTTSNGPFFTFDDVPYSKRFARLNEFRAWVNSQLAKGVSLRPFLTKFYSRFNDALNDWFTSMGLYRQI
jgi:hypothetical protein